MIFDLLIDLAVYFIISAPAAALFFYMGYCARAALEGKE